MYNQSGDVEDVGLRCGVCGVEEDSDGDDEGEVGMRGAVDGERLGLDRDDEVVKGIGDPKLPSKEEVEKHWVMGHLPYRSPN